MRREWVAILILIFAGSLSGCATTTREQKAASESIAWGAVMGTLIFPVVGTAVGAGMGWMGGKKLVKIDNAKRAAEIKDELEKQAVLRARIESLKVSHLLRPQESSTTEGGGSQVNIERPSAFLINEQIEQRLRPAVEEGWMVLLPTPDSLNLYLNETLFFAEKDILSNKGKRVLHLLEPLFLALPSNSQIYLEDPNDRPLESPPGGLIRLKLWNLASYLAAEMGVQVPLAINGRPFPSGVTLTSLPPPFGQEIRALRLRILLVSDT